MVLSSILMFGFCLVIVSFVVRAVWQWQSDDWLIYAMVFTAELCADLPREDRKFSLSAMREAYGNPGYYDPRSFAVRVFLQRASTYPGFMAKRRLAQSRRLEICGKIRSRGFEWSDLSEIRAWFVIERCMDDFASVSLKEDGCCLLPGFKITLLRSCC